MNKNYNTTMLQNINSQKINHNALEACRILQENGHQAYIVGGCVRDLLLGLIPKDWDIATSALPEQIIKIFSKTLPTGLQHGTITVILNGESLEITTFRTDGTYSDGRRPDQVKFVKSLDEDLSRRDLTINAIALDPISMVLLDPFGGIEDLKNGLIKAVGDPMLRFKEDGLRILRVARFAAKFGWAVDYRTMMGMKLSNNNLSSVSKERIKDELTKILKTGPQTGINLLIDTETIKFVSKRLNNHAITGALRHMLPLIDKYQGEWETRLALLFFPSSNKEIEISLRELTFSNAEIKKVLYLNSNIDKYYNTIKEWAILDVKYFIANLKNTAINENSYDEFCKYCVALDCEFANDHIYLKNKYIPLRKELKVNGNDLLYIGFNQGKSIKKALEAAYHMIVEFPELNEKESLIEFCKAYK